MTATWNCPPPRNCTTMERSPQWDPPMHFPRTGCLIIPLVALRWRGSLCPERVTVSDNDAWSSIHYSWTDRGSPFPKRARILHLPVLLFGCHCHCQVVKLRVPCGSRSLIDRESPCPEHRGVRGGNQRGNLFGNPQVGKPTDRVRRKGGGAGSVGEGRRGEGPGVTTNGRNKDNVTWNIGLPENAITR
jgi:hypothetical protein